MLKKEIIPLGCNCHPAYWLKKCNLQPFAYPFDLLCSPAHAGIQYCVDNLSNNFSLCLESLTRNETGHCVSTNYPDTLLFHHQALLSAHPRLKLDEHQKLQRRIERFKNTINTQEIIFLYCYSIEDQLVQESSLNFFEASVKELLATVKNSKLLVYFMEDNADSGFNWEPKSFIPRLSVMKYIRNTNVHEVWGEFPEFFLTLRNH